MFSLYGQFVKLAGFYVGVSSDVAVLSWLPLGLPPALSQFIAATPAAPRCH